MIRLWQTDIKAAPASERPDSCVSSCRLCPGVLHLNTPRRLQLMANEFLTLCVWMMRYPSAPLGGGSLSSLFKKGNWKTQDYVYTNCCNNKAVLEDVFDKTAADGTCLSSRALICLAQQPIRVIYSMAMPLIQHAVLLWDFTFRGTMKLTCFLAESNRTEGRAHVCALIRSCSK